jgi:hypothetical protein
MKTVVSNSAFNHESLSPTSIKPFDECAEWGKTEEWLLGLDSNQQPSGLTAHRRSDFSWFFAGFASLRICCYLVFGSELITNCSRVSGRIVAASKILMMSRFLDMSRSRRPAACAIGSESASALRSALLSAGTAHADPDRAAGLWAER